MRTRVTLDDDVYEVITDMSHRSGEHPGRILSRLARQALRSPKGNKRGRRFPMFDVPDDAPLIPASRIQRFLDEDGLA